MPIKLDWIDTGRHCSPTPCIFILLRGEITVFTSSAKANFSNPQALLPYILSFQLAVVKVLWKILIFKTCQASVLLWSTLSNCHFSISFLCVFFLFLCVYLCVFFLVYSVFLCCSCACLDYFLYFPVYLHWPFLSVTAFIATILARSIAEFIFQEFQFLFCCSSCLALYLHVSQCVVLKYSIFLYFYFGFSLFMDTNTTILQVLLKSYPICSS